MVEVVTTTYEYPVRAVSPEEAERIARQWLGKLSYEDRFESVHAYVTTGDQSDKAINEEWSEQR
jgi:hypothetical protein